MRSIKFVCLVAAPEWVEKVTSIFPDVPIVAAAIDRCLDEAGYFLPTIGDAGDRLFGTKIAHSRSQAASSSSRTTAGPSILRGLVWTPAIVHRLVRRSGRADRALLRPTQLGQRTRDQ